MTHSKTPELRHFIAINGHQFHSAADYIQALKTTAVAAEKLSETTAEAVKIACFVNGSGQIEDAVQEQAERLSVPVYSLDETSNGACLNRQIDQATAEGFTIFYRADADDVTDPDRFIHQARCFRNDAGDLCGGGLTYHNIRTSSKYDVYPAEHPGTADYLTNSYFLHPVLAFRLDALAIANIRYWQGRQEDKQLALQAKCAGLRVYNDQKLYGCYNLNPQARNSHAASRLTLQLNVAFLKATGQFHKLPIAWAIFLTSLLLPKQLLRDIRHRFRS